MHGHMNVKSSPVFVFYVLRPTEGSLADLHWCKCWCNYISV